MGNYSQQKEEKKNGKLLSRERIEVDELRAQCEGRWRGIYSHFGVDVGEGKHKPCPLCGGEDRFRCDGIATDGRYFCNQCGAGTAFELLMKSKNWDFPETIKNVAGVVGMVEKVVDTTKTVDPAVALRQLAESSKPISPSDHVSKYLRSRGLVLTPNDIRFCPGCYESVTRNKIPAMLAAIRDEDGKLVSIHRTYLNGNKKADVPSPKKMMPATKTLQGCAIRLFSPEDNLFESGKLGVAEGIETAMAAAQMFSIATWSCVSTSILETFVPPKGINHIVIFADNDANFAGQKSAYILANKLYLKDYMVEVVVPDKGDWNEVLLNEKV